MSSTHEALGLIAHTGETGYDGVHLSHCTQEGEAGLETWFILTNIASAMGDSVGRGGGEWSEREEVKEKKDA